MTSSNVTPRAAILKLLQYVGLVNNTLWTPTTLQAMAAATFEVAIMSAVKSGLVPGPAQTAARDADFAAQAAAAPAPPFAGAQPAWVAQLLAGNVAVLAAVQAATVAAAAAQVSAAASMIASTNALAVAHNSSVVSVRDPLHARVNAANVLPGAAVPPVAFPATKGDLHLMKNTGVNALLAFYAIPNPHPGIAHAGNLAAKRRLLALHLGIPGF